METQLKKNELFTRLQSDILSLEGFRAPAFAEKQPDLGLGPILKAFGGGIFPRAGMHEFISNSAEQTAASSGFMAVLAGKMMGQDGMCVWIGRRRSIYPFALSRFGISPDRVIFIDVKKDQDLMWAIEEALKCEALSVVVGEIKELSLTQSRRIQLAIETSKVTGFLHRMAPRICGASAAVCRWQISPLPAAAELRLPGLGLPCWQVTIEKVRNGEPGQWPVQWNGERFEQLNLVESTSKSNVSRVGISA